MKRANLIIIFLSFLFFLSTAALATVNNTPADAPSFDWIGWIRMFVLVVGLILLGWYQKYKIGILEKQVKTQKDIILNLKQYSDIIDIKKIKELVAFNESTVQNLKEVEIKELQSDYSEKIKLVELDRKELLTKIEQSKKTADNLKSDHMTLAKNSMDRVVFATGYSTIVMNFQFLSGVKDILILYQLSLLGLNNLKFEENYALFKKIHKIGETLGDRLALFDKMNLAKITQPLKGDKELEIFDAKKYSSITLGLQESIMSEISELERVIIEKSEAVMPS